MKVHQKHYVVKYFNLLFKMNNNIYNNKLFFVLKCISIESYIYITIYCINLFAFFFVLTTELLTYKRSSSPRNMI